MQICPSATSIYQPQFVSSPVLYVEELGNISSGSHHHWQRKVGGAGSGYQVPAVSIQGSRSIAHLVSTDH
jgi:hypothetical protein